MFITSNKLRFPWKQHTIGSSRRQSGKATAQFSYLDYTTAFWNKTGHGHLRPCVSSLPFAIQHSADCEADTTLLNCNIIQTLTDPETRGHALQGLCRIIQSRVGFKRTSSRAGCFTWLRSSKYQATARCKRNAATHSDKLYRSSVIQSVTGKLAFSCNQLTVNYFDKLF
jgi:hypothetical protein